MPKCSALPQILALLGGIAFAACQWLVFAYAPEEATLGLAQKIFYIHLPMSWWALVSFFVVWALPNTHEVLHGRRDGTFPRLGWRPTAAWATGLAVMAFLTLILVSRKATFLYFQF